MGNDFKLDCSKCGAIGARCQCLEKKQCPLAGENGHLGCGEKPTLRTCPESHEATREAQCPQCGMLATIEVGK